MPPPSTPVFSHRNTNSSHRNTNSPYRDLKSSYRDRKLLLILSATAKPSPNQRPRSSASSLLPLARWRERGPGGEGGDRANPSAAKLYKPKSPIKTTNNLTASSAPKKQPLRGLSPHPRPLSPTRGEGSKTIKPRAQPLARDTVPGYAGEGSKTVKPRAHLDR